MKTIHQMKKVLFLASLMLLVAMDARISRVQATEPYIGQVILFANNFCPRNWLEAKGQILPIANNNALYSLLGSRFGGDGRRTFALPKLPQPKNGMPKYCIAIRGIYPSRN